MVSQAKEISLLDSLACSWSPPFSIVQALSCQTTPLATPGTVPTRQRLDIMNEGLQRQARESRGEISFACDAIMYE